MRVKWKQNENEISEKINTLGQRASLQNLISGLLLNNENILYFLPAAAFAPVTEYTLQYRPELYRQEKYFMAVHGNKLGDRK